ncbi:uncharacterized protein BDW47DRAFT_123941 [Aspergillus candidus]|uniref:Uncharacterized protein n=1 Tax=Aspergillus candidus TaxID=41067 RepID=A0A2I2FH87_ASPCN|nr:hypothetical protein BDW47DRAFT_123941 [Aspergillus candidus]PLB39992.1 hypothetical protein BDW47DRAFT_123941 [Aspergillus candidus]
MAPQLGKPVFAAEEPQSHSVAHQDTITRQPTLHHHTQVTSDADALKFNAAASTQLQFTNNTTQPTAPDSDNDEQQLIISPYNDKHHLLDLHTLDTPNQLLALALTLLKPIRPDYATAPYTASFNWDEVFDFLRDLARATGHHWNEQDFYVVEFRSCLREDADPVALHELDAWSLQEAVESGGLLKYWFGTKNGKKENLATCVWRSREDARLGGAGPWHKRARGAARDLYERINFTTMRLVVGDDVGTWAITEWVDE